MVGIKIMELKNDFHYNRTPACNLCVASMFGCASVLEIVGYNLCVATFYHVFDLFNRLSILFGR